MVTAGPVKEWSPVEDRWLELDPDGVMDLAGLQALRERIKARRC